MNKMECDDPTEDTREWFLIKYGVWVNEGTQIIGFGRLVTATNLDFIRQKMSTVEGEVVHCLEYPDERSVLVLADSGDLYSIKYNNIDSVDGEVIEKY